MKKKFGFIISELLVLCSCLICSSLVGGCYTVMEPEQAIVEGNTLSIQEFSGDNVKSGIHVKVFLEQPELSATPLKEMVTDTSGIFRFQLPLGTYRLVFEKAGYGSVERQQLQVVTPQLLELTNTGPYLLAQSTAFQLCERPTYHFVELSIDSNARSGDSLLLHFSIEGLSLDTLQSYVPAALLTCYDGDPDSTVVKDSTSQVIAIHRTSGRMMSSDVIPFSEITRYFAHPPSRLYVRVYPHPAHLGSVYYDLFSFQYRYTAHGEPSPVLKLY